MQLSPADWQRAVTLLVFHLIFNLQMKDPSGKPIDLLGGLIGGGRHLVNGYVKGATEHNQTSYADSILIDSAGDAPDHVGEAVALLSYSW